MRTNLSRNIEPDHKIWTWNLQITATAPQKISNSRKLLYGSWNRRSARRRRNPNNSGREVSRNGGDRRGAGRAPRQENTPTPLTAPPQQLQWEARRGSAQAKRRRGDLPPTACVPLRHAQRKGESADWGKSEGDELIRVARISKLVG
jgi:hypothetical protein